MGSIGRLKISGVATALLLFGSACSGSGSGDTNAETESGDLAFAEESASGLPAGCDKMVSTIIRTGGLFHDEDQAELMDVWIAAAPLTKPPATKYLEIVTAVEGSDSKNELSQAEASAVDLLREIDDLTYQACGTPAYSAAMALSVVEAHPLSLPCFTYQPSRDASYDLLYGAVDCGTGQSLYLHSDGEWYTEIEPPPTTTAPPAPTTSRVTRPEPSIPKPTTTLPPTSAAPSTTLDPAIPPPTNEDGSVITTLPPETTTTTLPDPP